jgi:23S rRNA-/tRNA-specific pseudouridylate synthase
LRLSAFAALSRKRINESCLHIVSTSFSVTPREQGQTLAALIKKHLAVSWTQARKLIEQRRVRVNDQVSPEPVRRLKRGDRVDVEQEQTAPKK